MHANVSIVLSKVYCSMEQTTSLPFGQIFLLCPVSFTFHALIRQFTMSLLQLSERSFTHKKLCKSSYEQVHHRDVTSLAGSIFMVKLVLFQLVTSLISHDRILNTIHEALSISGSSFFVHSAWTSDPSCAT